VVVTAGVIFDCDGVLVDTEIIANRALASMVTELGIPTTTEESIARYMGRSWTSVMSILTEELGVTPPKELLRRYREAVEHAWRSELQPVPGIVEALDRIALPYCVASSGDHDRIRLTLGITGLLPRFEGRIFSASDVANGKPEPDLFLHAAKRMGFDVPRTTVVEDTVPGVQAGKAAGMRVLAYARLIEPYLLAAAGGEVFSNIEELRACSHGQGGQTDGSRSDHAEKSLH
jgi:HAD superfamily hydrolase (TIGR01509 family)